MFSFERFHEMQKITLFLATYVLTFLLSCGDRKKTDNISEAQTLQNKSFSGESAQLWNNYVGSLPLEKIQPECLPLRIEHAGNYKGTITLFHGFSACPQQFWELGKKLSDSGYEVLLPLLQGHGYKRINNTENLEQLPNAFTWKDYKKILKTVAEISIKSPGKHSIGGLSGGASLATTAILSEEFSGIWQQALIMAPMYNSIDNWKRIFPEVVGNIPLVNELLGRSWGEQCETDSANSFGLGNYKRGGFCSFKVNHAAAIDSLGQEAINLMQQYQNNKIQKIKNTKVQFVYTDFDNASRGNSLNLAIKALKFPAGNKTLQVNACSFPVSVPHSFISRYDSEKFTDPERKKPWLNSLIQNSVNFFSEGKEFENTKEASIYPNVNRCLVNNTDSSQDTWFVP
jgi:Serine aminopeptidase, S33